MEKWQCNACGYIHEGPLPEDFTCPWCNQDTSWFEQIESGEEGEEPST